MTPTEFHAHLLHLSDTDDTELARAVAVEVAHLMRLLNAAHASEWSTPPRTSSGVSRSSSDVSNPTADTALDTSRLRLRSEVIAAERVLVTAGDTVRAARVALAAALKPYEGTAE